MLINIYKYSKELCPRKRNKILFGKLRLGNYITYLLLDNTHTMKHCKKCDTTQPLENFCRDKRSIDGRTWTCKSCVKAYQTTIKDKLKEYQKQYQPKYKEEHKEYFREYLKVYHKEVYRDKHLDYVKKWRAANPDKVAQYKKVMAERKKQANDQ